ncbi:MAG: hypothetical protein V3W19_15565, partial [Desulfatiglandales bacterium]
MKEKLKGLLKELTQIPGVSGFEGDIGTYIKKAFSECADEVEVDSLGNVFVTRRGKYEHPSLMIAAHIDQIGGIVKGIEESGFLRLDRLAGVIPSLLLGRKVLVNGHFGVIGVKPAHLQSPEERSRVADIKELYVDVGALCAEEVSKMGIRVGDPISYISPIEEFTNSDRLCGGAIDDRLGCAVLLALFQKLK